MLGVPNPSQMINFRPMTDWNAFVGKLRRMMGLIMLLITDVEVGMDAIVYVVCFLWVKEVAK